MQLVPVEEAVPGGAASSVLERCYVRPGMMLAL